MQKLAAFPEVETRIFDLEKPGTDQGFEPGSYDLIIGTNVLHAVCDVRATLRNLHELLSEGGSLVFMDVATPQLWTEAVFGLTSGWWRFTDADGYHQPLLSRPQWENALKQSGFDETASLPGLMGPQGEGQVVLLARKSLSHGGIDLSPDEGTTVPVSEKSWLIFADTSGLGDRLAERLRADGAHCRTVRPGPPIRLSASGRLYRTGLHRLTRLWASPRGLCKGRDARSYRLLVESGLLRGTFGKRIWQPLERMLCCTSARRSIT